jgi:hypothetical protein
MSEDYLAQQPIATWNPARGVWETNQVNLLCGHLEPYLETWPKAGTTRRGQAFTLQTQGHHISGFESSLSPILLRTPAASEGERGHQDPKVARARGGQVSLSGQVIYELLPTPIVDDSKNNGANPNRIEGLSSVVYKTEVKQDWGRFQPAITSWESVTGREAPNPTKPDARDGSRRLSSAFAEWLMGVPKGWITGVGLTREQELKAAGNGVVPQQAYLALEILLGAKS